MDIVQSSRPSIHPYADADTSLVERGAVSVWQGIDDWRDHFCGVFVMMLIVNYPTGGRDDPRISPFELRLETQIDLIVKSSINDGTITSFAISLIGFWQLAVALEVVFQWPGIGLLYIKALLFVNVQMDKVQMRALFIYCYIHKIREEAIRRFDGASADACTLRLDDRVIQNYVCCKCNAGIRIHHSI